MTTPHKYNLGIIGNCNYLAYVNDQANIAWMCWPRFDSSFVFGNLLDATKGGDFYIQPHELTKFKSKQYYLENTNILVTEFTNDEDSFRVLDYAPRFLLYERYFKPIVLMRKVEILKGKPQVVVCCSPRYEYGEKTLNPIQGSNHISYMGGPHEIRLTTNTPLNYILNKTPFYLTRNLYFSLNYGTPLEAPLGSTCDEFLQKTKIYWRTWVKRSSIPSLYQEEVIRSALALKLHQYEDTGAIIAAGTTSLPEANGAGRNWDYRYCWPRDSYYTLKAFNLISHFSELESYAHFVHNLVSSDIDHLQPVYAIDGNAQLNEKIMELNGYLNNTPVRIGNDARNQTQFDVYGQILLALLPLYNDRRLSVRDDKLPTTIIYQILKKIEKCFDQPDSGIWEFRNLLYRHTHTYLFHWAGCSAAERIAENYGDKTLKKYAQKLRIKAVEYIERCYDPIRKCYKASIEGEHLDASTLLLITMNYLKPYSQKSRDHLEAIYRELQSPNGLLYRYKHQDDFGSTDSSFLMCSFWYIEALAVMGKIQEANAMLKKVLTGMNGLKLLSEDVEGNQMSQWGNFPQTYSHVGLINAVFKIEQGMNKQPFQTVVSS